MDDVLLDTTDYLIKWHKKKFPFYKAENCGSREVHTLLDMTWQECWGDLPTEFWESIPFCPWGRDVIKLCEKYFGDNVYLLTSPIPNGVCSMGKQLWVNHNMPRYKNKLIIGHKKYVIVADDGILIDDSYSNEEKFASAGKSESFFLFPSYQNKLHGIVKSMYDDPSIAVKMVDNLLSTIKGS